MPTVVATMRWPCSQNRFPTILGNTWPLESGQSFVARPASLLVTSAPAMIKKNVAQATSKAKRFKPRFIYDCQLFDPQSIGLIQSRLVNHRSDCQLPFQSAIGNRQSAMLLVPVNDRKL